MPTILEWLGLPVPRQCDGRSLLPLLRGGTPADWRTEVHYEFDFRDLYCGSPNRALGVPMDKCCAGGRCRTRTYKYVHFAALPPLFFDLKADPGQFVNRAADPGLCRRACSSTRRRC